MEDTIKTDKKFKHLNPNFKSNDNFVGLNFIS